MSCTTGTVDDDTIHAYVAGKLPEAQAEAFELHLLHCAGCREAVRLGAGARSALIAGAVAPRRRFAGAAAAILTLAAASIVVVMVRRSGGEHGLRAFTPAVFRGFAGRGAAD